MNAPRENLEAERAVLGAIMLDNDALNDVRQILAPDDFYGRAHAIVFECMRELFERGRPVDLVTVRAWLLERGFLQKAGGDEQLLALVETIPTVENVEHHAEIVLGEARRRRLVLAAREIERRATSAPSDELAEYLAEAEAIIAEAARSSTRGRGPVSMRMCVDETFQAITSAAGGQLSGAIPSRFSGLNERLGGGFRAGELVLVAGRPGMGKTALGIDLALSLASAGPGIVFSLEMSREELTKRALAAHARVDGNRIRTAKLTRNDWDRMVASAGKLAASPLDGLHIDDEASARLGYIRSTARRQRARAGVSWIVIDYLQLMRSEERRESREAEVSDISRGLKALAKELGVPVIALSQLNRAVELRARTDRRPQLSDLRESGSLEQDADVVLFIHREELYNRDDPALRGLAEIIIGKQRSGPLGTVHCRYFAEYTTFEELARREDHEDMERGGFTRSVDRDEREDFEDPS